MPDRVIAKLIVERPLGIRTYGLDIIDISDSIERALIVHELPYRNGAVLEDLGSKARIVSVNCAFYAGAALRINPLHGITPSYSAHFLFLKDIQEETALELHHPKYRMMKGKVRNINIINNARDEYAEVRFEFVEQTVDVAVVPAFEVTAAVSDAFRNAQGFSLSAIKDSVKASLDASTAVEVLDQVIDFTQDMADQVTNVSNATREYIKGVDIVVNKFDTILKNIEQPAKSILGTIEYTSDLPGRLLYSVAQTTERYQQLYAGIESTPVTYVSSFVGGMTAMQSAFQGYVEETLAVDQIKAMTAQWSCIMAARVLRTDEDSRDLLRQKEKERAFDKDGKLVGITIRPNIMTTTDLERILYDTKIAAQESIDASRDNRGLKDEINALQDFVNTTKLERLRIKTIDVSNTPLHVICLQNKLNYETAERILKLNPGIKNPTFVDGSVDIYVR